MTGRALPRRGRFGEAVAASSEFRQEVIGRCLIAGPIFVAAGILTGRILLGVIFLATALIVVAVLIWRGSRRVRSAPPPQPVFTPVLPGPRILSVGLANFIGCWFNQDHYLFGHDFENVIFNATDGLPSRERQALAREARELGDSTLSAEALDRALGRAGMEIDPEAFAPDAKAFLRRLSRTIEP